MLSKCVCSLPLGPGQESKIKISCKNNLVKATWLEHEDKESGIAHVEWCIETVHNTCDVRPWESLPSKALEAFAIIHSLPTTNGVRVMVRITNGVGNNVLLTSSQRIPRGKFPPLVKVAVVRQLNDTKAVLYYQANTDAIVVTWSLPQQNNSLHYRTQAALAEYDHNGLTNVIKKWHGEPLLFDFVDIPRGRLYITFSGDRLKPYVKYQPIVRICNEFSLCTDSSCDPVIIVPDAPPDIQINTTDTVQGTERERWKNYVRIPNLPRKIFEETLYVPDPFRVLIKANLKKANETTLFSEHVPISYQAIVHRITSGENNTRNETISTRQIFNNSHLHNGLDVCCSKRNKKLQVVNPDRQFIPVAKTNLFGVTVSAFGKDLLVASSQNAVYVFSIESLHITPISHESLNTSINDSYVKVKAKNDTILVSAANTLVLHKIKTQNLTSASWLLYFTNCNHTMRDTPEHCSGDNQWSATDSVGDQFAYDGSEFIALSGRHPRQGYCVVGVFRNNKDTWELHQVLGHEEMDFTVPYSIATNQKFMAIAGSEIRVYSKTLDSFWKKETILSENLPQNGLGEKYVYLTSNNTLFMLTVNTRTLTVFQMETSPPKAITMAMHIFSEDIDLTGSLDVSQRSKIVVAVGIRSDGRDGAEIILYDRMEGCTRMGRVLCKTESEFAHPGASVAISENYLIIGTPGKAAWPTNYFNEGTGRLHVTTFCEKNHFRKKVFEKDQRERVLCSPCEPHEKAYPGFSEKCNNCSNSICLNHSSDATFKVSHCENYPCSVRNNQTIRQNVSRDNLTITESKQNFDSDQFYLPESTHSYFIRLTQLSATGTTTTSDSFPFSIDYTSPEAGSVYDGLGSDDSKNCSSNTTFSPEHQCTSRSFSDTDIDYTNNTNEISARWLDFGDNESNIAHYFWCIGSSPLADDIMQCENVTNSQNRTVKGVSLRHNDQYYVTVLVCNYAGLCTAKSSDGVLVDTTPPVLHYVRDGLIGPDIDYQVSLSSTILYIYLSALNKSNH